MGRRVSYSNPGKITIGPGSGTEATVFDGGKYSYAKSTVGILDFTEAEGNVHALVRGNEDVTESCRIPGLLKLRALATTVETFVTAKFEFV